MYKSSQIRETCLKTLSNNETTMTIQILKVSKVSNQYKDRPVVYTEAERNTVY